MINKLQYFFQLVISIFCFIVLVRIVQFEAILESFRQAVLAPLVIVFLTMFPTVFVRAWRWQFILKKKGVVVPVNIMYRVTFIGMALNLFLPAGVGDVARSYYGWQSQGHKEVMLASAIADKAVALFTLCILGIVCGLKIGAYQIVWMTMALIVPLGLLLFVPWRLPWNLMSKLFTLIFKKNLNIDNLLSTFRMDFGTLLGCFVISLIGWGFTNTMYYYACRAFSANADAWYIFSVAPLINLIRVIPITISGLGTADALIVYLFSSMNVNKSEAMAASMIINLFLIALPGFIGVVLIFFNRKTKQQ